MKVTLKDGVVKEFDKAVSVLDIATSISEGLARNACCGIVNGEVEDLRFVVDKDSEVSICNFDTPEGKKAFRHTASHMMAQAIKRLFPETKLAIGPSIDDGFYYDFDRETPFTEQDLEKIEAEMKKIAKENLPLEKFELPRAEAIQLMKAMDEPYKVELIEDLPEDAVISFYKQGEFTDLCAGPHLLSTKNVKAIKLMSVAGAYWRGSEKNKMLSRIYGTAYTKAADLEAYLTMLEEAKKRDHRKL
ncbi:MAG: TGS domain-containing protein, partial [Anaerotignaceae bacterium]